MATLISQLLRGAPEYKRIIKLMAALNENRIDNDEQRDENNDGNRQETVDNDTSVHFGSSGRVRDTRSRGDTRGLFGYSILHTAASNGQADLLKSFLPKDSSNVNSKTVDGGYTPLHLAALAGHTDCVEILLKCENIDIHVADAFDRTPLVAAEQNFKTDVARLLRSHGKYIALLLCCLRHMCVITRFTWLQDIDLVVTVFQLLFDVLDVHAYPQV